MVSLNKNATDLTNDNMVNHEVETLKEVSTLSTSPVFICGVNRKINIGNFENIDVYAGITLPLNDVSLEDKDKLTEIIEAAASYGFSIVSKETGERYQLIKESQQGK